MRFLSQPCEGEERKTSRATKTRGWQRLLNLRKPGIFSAPPCGRRQALGLLATLWAAGCGHEPDIQFISQTKPPPVQLVQPRPRNIVRIVGQPSFIESFERTSIYNKPTAYIQRWNVDIGDRVKKDEPLATLFAPERLEELETRKADVMLDRERIDLAKEVVEVARAEVTSAEARLKEAEAIIYKYDAEVTRWQTECDRLKRQVDRVVVNSGVLFESTNQLESSVAARDKARATIKTAQAEVGAARARLGKAEVDVRVAEATLKVADYQEQSAQAWVNYLTLKAPFAGVVSVRNANTFDIVLPATGDPTAYYLSPDISTSAAAPIYVVDRLDIVRIFLDIPEQDANFVNIGTKASVLARAFRDTELPAKVTRVSWALNMKSRTLRAEVDLPNPERQLLPGMYAYVKVVIERPNVLALPLDALVYNGQQTLCWLYENGKAVQAELETGVSDDRWIEVTNRRPPVAPEAPADSVAWTPISGTEQVILGDLSGVTDGGAVEIAPATATTRPESEPSPPNEQPEMRRSPGETPVPETSSPAKPGS
jgi:multidrug efflux pump subunit AcrA (membrane-fusion protein)